MYVIAEHDQTQKYDGNGAQTLCVDTTYAYHNHNSQTLDIDIVIFKLSKLCKLLWMLLVNI